MATTLKELKEFYETIKQKSPREEYDRIYNYLKEKDADYDEIYQFEGGVEISVSWGDWKHSHAYLDYLMGELGYEKNDEQITEEDGSDAYSSIHYYYKRNSYVSV